MFKSSLSVRVTVVALDNHRDTSSWSLFISMNSIYKGFIKC